MATQFQANVINALSTTVDAANMSLLTDVINAAEQVATMNSVTDSTTNGNGDGIEPGAIAWGGMEASLQGTGGVALLEYAKDAIQTAASNISGTGTLEIQTKKIVERKIGAQ